MAKNTKYVLGEALKELLQKKPLNKITVTEIVDLCGLNRMTFYYHFKDIYDLLEWVCISDAEKAVEGRTNHNNWQDGLVGLFGLLKDNKAFVSHVYDSSSRMYITDYVYRLTERLIIDVIDELDSAHTLNEENKEKIASFYDYAFLGTALRWIESGMEDDPVTITRELAILLNNSFEDAVKEFSKEQ